MDKNITMRLLMYESVLTTLKAHQTLVDGSPALANGVERLETEIEAFKVLIYSQSKDTRWISAKKCEMTDNMLSKAFALNKVLLAYAKASGQTEIFNHFNLTVTQYMSGGVHAKISRVNELLEALPLHLAGLTPYNVNAGSISELETLRDELAEYLQGPRLARAKRSLLTKQVKVAKAKIDALLKFEIDALMFMFKESEPEFFAHYKIVRKVDQSATKHRTGEESGNEAE